MRIGRNSKIKNYKRVKGKKSRKKDRKGVIHPILLVQRVRVVPVLAVAIAVRQLPPLAVVPVVAPVAPVRRHLLVLLLHPTALQNRNRLVVLAQVDQQPQVVVNL